MAKVLVVDDDEDLVQTICDKLRQENYAIETAYDGEQALNLLCCSQFDVVVLDWDLPYISGIDACKQFRASGGSTPILMLTGKTAIHEKEKGFDSGVDDYLVKPFEMRELAVRLRALLRRASGQLSSVLVHGNLQLDPEKHLVFKGGVEKTLLPREFSLLEFFMRNPNVVFSADTLLQRVWMSDDEASTDAIRTCIKRIRQKVDCDESLPTIETVHRIGYRFRTF